MKSLNQDDLDILSKKNSQKRNEINKCEKIVTLVMTNILYLILLIGLSTGVYFLMKVDEIKVKNLINFQ